MTYCGGFWTAAPVQTALCDIMMTIMHRMACFHFQDDGDKPP